jgi:uncharacterized membrane protein YccC
MSAAGLISFAAAHLIGLSQIYWAVLTAIIVMQASIGGSLKAVIDRFLGTIGGAGWGGAVTLAVPTAVLFHWVSRLPSRLSRWRLWQHSGRAFVSRR